MPRYPNVWFYVERSLAPSYDEAVKFVTDRLRTAMRLREFFGPFDNPEGCDFETTLEHLQPWESRNARARCSTPMRSTCATTIRRWPSSRQPKSS